MDVLILIVVGLLGALFVARYVYRIVVKGEPDICSGCSGCSHSHNCSSSASCPMETPSDGAKQQTDLKNIQ